MSQMSLCGTEEEYLVGRAAMQSGVKSPGIVLWSSWGHLPTGSKLQTVGVYGVSNVHILLAIGLDIGNATLENAAHQPEPTT